MLEEPFIPDFNAHTRFIYTLYIYPANIAAVSARPIHNAAIHFEVDFLSMAQFIMVVTKNAVSIISTKIPCPGDTLGPSVWILVVM